MITRLLFLVFALLLLLLAGFLGTAVGLQAGIHLADRLLPGDLRATVTDGRLFDSFELHDVTYRHADDVIEIDTMALDWRSPALLRRTLLIDSLRIGTLQITTRREPDATTAIAPPSLPLAVEIRRLDITSIAYHHTGTGAEMQLRQVHARGSARDDRIALRQLSLAGDHFIADGEGHLQLAEHWPLTTTFRYSLAWPDGPPALGDLDGRIEIEGDLRQLDVLHVTTAPLASRLNMAITDVAENPAWRGALQADAIELRSFTDIEGRADLGIEFEGSPAATSLRATAALTGEIAADWLLALELDHAEAARIGIASLAFEDRGRRFDLIGQGELVLNDDPDIDFSGEWRYLDIEPVTGKLQISGRPDDYRLTVTAVADAPIASGWTLRGRGDTGSLTIETLRGELADGVVDSQGHIDWRGEQPVFELHGDWHGLALTVDDELPVHAPGGKFSLGGTTENYTVALSGDLAAGEWPAATLSLTASGTAEGLDIDVLEAALLDGRLRADGRLEWLDRPQLQLNITGEGINPGRQWPDWPGRLDGATALLAERIEERWLIAFQDLVVQGVLREYPLMASGNLHAGPDEYRIEKLVIHSGDSRLSADGLLGDASRLDWQLHSPDLGQLWPDAGGRIEGRGRLRGRLTAPEVSAALSGDGIRTPWLRADTVAADIELDTRADRFDARVDVTAAEAADQFIDRLSIRSHGLLERHRLTMEIVTPDRQLSLDGNGNLQDDTWLLNLDQAAIRDPVAGEWQLAQRLDLVLRRDAVTIEPHCWQQQSARLCGHGDWQQAGVWRIEYDLAGLELGDHIVLPDGLPPVTGTLASNLTARGRTAEIESINGTLRLSAASLQPADEFDPMLIDELTLDLADVDGGTQLNVFGRLGGVYPGELQGVLRTGPLRIDPDTLPATPIEGRVNASIGDLRPLLAVYTALDARQAAVELDARIGGRIEQPDLTGTLKLTAATVTIIEAGLELAEVELQIDGRPDDDLVLTGLARNGPGTLAIDGKLRITDAGIRIVGLDITGEDFETLNLPEAWVLTSPELKVKHENEVMRVSGEVTVPEAMLEPLEAGGGVRVSADEKIVTDDVTEPDTDPLQIAAEVRLQLGDQVRFRGPGFSGRLTGALDIRRQPGRPATGEGMLNIVDGVYGAYGQELRITTGQLIYTGQPLDDPELNIRAVRTIGAVEAGVRAFGSARRPEAELFSTPSMPEADILAYLIVGRPVSGLAAGEGNMLMDAAVAMGIRGTESLRQNIADVLGLDELALTASGLEDADARLTVGKYLTPRLYISYAAGLVETAVDTMRLRYTLTPRLTLEAEQGSGTGADLLYQIER